MFIDKPTVPIQLEVVLDVVHAVQTKKASADSIERLIQPKGLPDVTSTSKQAALHLSAARELGLITQDGEGNFRLSKIVREGKPTADQMIIDAFDQFVLSDAKIEPWFGRIYAFVIARSRCIPGSQSARDDLCKEFNSALPPHIDKSNPANSTKLPHYLRWYCYVGMGWYDPSGSFVPDPTVRLRRSLTSIFSTSERMDAADFMSSLASVCPELDTGQIFSEVAASVFNKADRVCTSALAAALRNLHDEGFIRLDCPADSQGWSLERGGSERNNDTLKSDRFDRVDLIKPDDLS
jgi:hypothetical protein